MNTAVYPGSFDPITNGHLDIIQRISPLYDQVVLLVSQSSSKNYLFSVEERTLLLKESVKHLNNVNVVSYEGLTVNYLKSIQANVIVRGLRAVVDFEYEMAMACMNKKLAPEIETILIFASPESYYISSRAIKEIARFQGKIDHLVPAHVIAPIQEKMNRKA